MKLPWLTPAVSMALSVPRWTQEQGAVAEEKIDETISNVRIDTDGDVGQVWFDYSFVKGSYKEN